MTLEDDHTPERQTPNGLSTTLRQKIMRRVRSYFCPTPLYDSLAAKFDKLVETLGWPADPGSARAGNAAMPLVPASHTDECAPVGAALGVVDVKHPDIWAPDLDEEEVDGDDCNAKNSRTNQVHLSLRRAWRHRQDPAVTPTNEGGESSRSRPERPRTRPR